MANNYTLGRGELHFAQFLQNTQTPGGERYLGNSPEFNATIESENLDHFNSDRGIREKDASIVLEVNRTATFTTDNINAANVALFFFGSKTALVVMAATIDDEAIPSVNQGHGYQLGMTDANPAGAKGLEEYSTGVNVIVTAGTSAAASGTVTFSGAGNEDDTVTIGSTVYTFKATPSSAFDVDVGASANASASNLAAAINAGAGEGTAYGTGTTEHPDVTATANAAVVTITAKVGGAGGNSISLAVAGDDLAASGATLTGGTGTAFIEGTDYKVDMVHGRIEIVEGGNIVDGTDLLVSYKIADSTRERMISGSTAVEGALRYIAYNPIGKNYDWYMPWVKLSPNGDYSLKGDDWQTIPFNVEILKKAGREAIYVEGEPLLA